MVCLDEAKRIARTVVVGDIAASSLPDAVATKKGLVVVSNGRYCLVSLASVCAYSGT